MIKFHCLISSHLVLAERCGICGEDSFLRSGVCCLIVTGAAILVIGRLSEYGLEAVLNFSIFGSLEALYMNSALFTDSPTVGYLLRNSLDGGIDKVDTGILSGNCF